MASKKKEIALFLAALLLGWVGAEVWRLGRAPRTSGGTAGGALAEPENLVKTALGSLFSRPTPSYSAPVDAPSLAAPVPERFGEKMPAADEPWTGGSAAGSSLPSSRGGSAGGAGGPPWGLSPASGGQGSFASAPAASAPAPAAPPSGQTAASGSGFSPSDSRTLRRLEKKAARAQRTDVSVGAAPAGIADPMPSAYDGGPAAAPSAASPSGVPSADAGGASLGSASGGADPAAGGAPAAAAAPADPAGVATSSAADDGSLPTDDQIESLSPDVGSPQVSAGAPGITSTPSGFLFAARKGMGRTVEPMVIKGPGFEAIKYTSDLYEDPNGAGNWYKKRGGRPTTALKYSKTESLNPGRIPFIVIPRDFRADFPDVKLGDYAAVSYGGKTLYAIVGDLGPAGVLGAGSISLERGLRIEATRRSGGAPGGVTYMILAGSRDAKPPRDAATIQENGRRLFERDGIPVN